MDDQVREARHQGLTGDPGDEQAPICLESFEAYGGALTIMCVLAQGHEGEHSTGGSMPWGGWKEDELRLRFIAKDPADKPFADVLTDLAVWAEKNLPPEFIPETPPWLEDNKEEK